jgi:hypothetical protein
MGPQEVQRLSHNRSAAWLESELQRKLPDLESPPVKGDEAEARGFGG